MSSVSTALTQEATHIIQTDPAGLGTIPYQQICSDAFGTSKTYQYDGFSSEIQFLNNTTSSGIVALNVLYYPVGSTFQGVTLLLLIPPLKILSQTIDEFTRNLNLLIYSQLIEAPVRNYAVDYPLFDTWRTGYCTEADFTGAGDYIENGDRVYKKGGNCINGEYSDASRKLFKDSEPIIRLRLIGVNQLCFYTNATTDFTISLQTPDTKMIGGVLSYFKRINFGDPNPSQKFIVSNQYCNIKNGWFGEGAHIYGYGIRGMDGKYYCSNVWNDTRWNSPNLNNSQQNLIAGFQNNSAQPKPPGLDFGVTARSLGFNNMILAPRSMMGLPSRYYFVLSDKLSLRQKTNVIGALTANLPTNIIGIVFPSQLTASNADPTFSTRTLGTFGQNSEIKSFDWVVSSCVINWGNENNTFDISIMDEWGNLVTSMPINSAWNNFAATSSPSDVFYASPQTSGIAPLVFASSATTVDYPDFVKEDLRIGISQPSYIIRGVNDGGCALASPFTLGRINISPTYHCSSNSKLNHFSRIFP